MHKAHEAAPKQQNTFLSWCQKLSKTAEDLPDRGPGPLGRAGQERLGLFRNHHGQRQNQHAVAYSRMTRLGPVPNLVRTHTRV